LHGKVLTNDNKDACGSKIVGMSEQLYLKYKVFVSPKKKIQSISMYITNIKFEQEFAPREDNQYPP